MSTREGSIITVYPPRALNSRWPAGLQTGTLHHRSLPPLTLLPASFVGCPHEVSYSVHGSYARHGSPSRHRYVRRYRFDAGQISSLCHMCWYACLPCDTNIAQGTLDAKVRKHCHTKVVGSQGINQALVKGAVASAQREAKAHGLVQHIDSLLIVDIRCVRDHSPEPPSVSRPQPCIKRYPEGVGGEARTISWGYCR